MLTANHCGPATTTIFMFNYESPGCPNVDGPTNQTVAGCTQIFNSSASDVYLVRMNSAAPLAYNPYFSGWNANDVASTSSVCIHHPSGDIKKITFDNNAPQSNTWSGTPANSHWRILAWDDGTTEPGSSGSPLFDQNHRITGQLHGGTASCSNNIDDYFGKFSLSMTNGLRAHLDPTNSGVMTLDGFDPQAGGFVSGIVITEENTGIPDATVQVIGESNSATTNIAGQFIIPLPDGVTYDLAISKFGYQSDTLFGVTITEGDTTYVVSQLIALPIITVLNEDFETGAPGWTHSSAGGTWVDDWHISTERAHTTTHSYKCGSTTTGTYQALNDARLLSPVLNNLPASASLTFWMGMEGEVSAAFPDSAYDGGILEIAMNGGAFTQVTPTGGYTETFRILRGGGNPVTGPMPGLPCWSDSVPAWAQRTVDLSAYAGSNVQLRFRFGSDAAGNKEGWYLDDILVQAVGELSTVTIPEELTIFVDGEDVMLRWLADENPMYRVYTSTDVNDPLQTLVDETDQNSYTIVGGATADSQRYYTVVGYQP
ncbi:MAG: carboxypeptidase regulatory-like domain-containing protein [bacterium]|nr:carboxypeptidase regulatory-like domain-containing protein [bacterium]